MSLVYVALLYAYLAHTIGSMGFRSIERISRLAIERWVVATATAHMLVGTSHHRHAITSRRVASLACDTVAVIGETMPLIAAGMAPSSAIDRILSAIMPVAESCNALVALLPISLITPSPIALVALLPIALDALLPIVFVAVAIRLDIADPPVMDPINPIAVEM